MKIKLYKCKGLQQTHAQFWTGYFEIGQTYRGTEYDSKLLWINGKYVDRDQFIEVDKIKLIDCVLEAYKKMPETFFANELIPKVYNPNGSHGGTIVRVLRRLKKYKKINFEADNTGKYTKL